eukprot:7843569-Pyramimonas_sp.AAC.1
MAVPSPTSGAPSPAWTPRAGLCSRPGTATCLGDPPVWVAHLIHRKTASAYEPNKCSLTHLVTRRVSHSKNNRVTPTEGVCRCDLPPPPPWRHFTDLPTVSRPLTRERRALLSHTRLGLDADTVELTNQMQEAQ